MPGDQFSADLARLDYLARRPRTSPTRTSLPARMIRRPSNATPIRGPSRRPSLPPPCRSSTSARGKASRCLSASGSS